MEVNSYASMMEEVALFNPGDEVDVEFLRDGKTMTARLKLLNSNGNTQIVHGSRK
jgi:S1-C subfamily serine protease